MSRNKGTPSAKDAIEALILIIQRHATPSSSTLSSSPPPFRVTAELLRRGKHDVPDASLPLFTFLHEFLKAFFKPLPLNTRYSSSSAAYTSLSPSPSISAIVGEVIIHVTVLGYPGVETLLKAFIYGGDQEAAGGGGGGGGGVDVDLVRSKEEGGGVKGCSRELTIVFGWLLAHFRIPTLLFPFRRDSSRNDVVGSAGDVTNDNLASGGVPESLLKSSSRSHSLRRSNDADDKKGDDPVGRETEEQRREHRHQLKRLQWELGKLNLTWRKWFQTRKKKEAFVRKIHRMTEEGGGGGPKSSGDVDIREGPPSSSVKAERVPSAAVVSQPASAGETQSVVGRAPAPSTAKRTGAGVEAGVSATTVEAARTPSSGPSAPSTFDRSSTRLSAIEATVLSSPRDYRSASSALDDHLKYLKAWTLWKSGGSGLFWKWMESVVEAKAREGAEGGERGSGGRGRDDEDVGGLVGGERVANNDEISVTTSLDVDPDGIVVLTPRLAAKLKNDLSDEMKNIHATLETNEDRIQEILGAADDDEDSEVDSSGEIRQRRSLFASLGSQAATALDAQRLSSSRFPRDADGLRMVDETRNSVKVEEALLRRIRILRGERNTLAREKAESMEEFDPTELLNDCVVLPSLSVKSIRDTAMIDA